MKILAVDVGTGTQDILLYDPRLDLENAFKLVLPSPTMVVRSRLKQATAAGRPVLLKGVTMGGGPCQWAAEDHIRAGYDLFATLPAARTFNDDRTAIEAMGVQLLSEDEASSLPEEVVRIDMQDFDFDLIRQTFTRYGIDLNDLAAVAVAVFDHGAAPAEVSDRKFRFDYLDERIRASSRLSSFAFLRNDIPAIMTRLLAVAQSATNVDVPLVVMDTAPAAVLGALFDPLAQRNSRLVVANVGNFHTLAFRLGQGGIEGVFEHHTGLIDRTKLEGLIRSLADGSLSNAQVFDDHGHGALVYNPTPFSPDANPGSLVVTGPRRSMLFSSSLNPYFAVPFGDMMLAGCYGLLSAAADLLPNLTEPIRAGLYQKNSSGNAPWDA